LGGGLRESPASLLCIQRDAWTDGFARRMLRSILASVELRALVAGGPAERLWTGFRAKLDRVWIIFRQFLERITWGLPGVEVHGVVGQDGLLREDLAQLHRVLGPARRRAAAAGPELDELAAPGGVAEGDELLARGDALLDLGGGDVDDVLARGDLATGRARGEGGGRFHAEEVLRVVLHLHGAVGGVVAAGLVSGVRFTVRHAV
jgi:hypothetical protein